MEILIKLDKRLYEYAKHHTLTSSEIDEICDAIVNGTIPPKGHGDLIDINELTTVTEIRPDGSECTYVPYSEIENANVVVEADKEG